MGKFAPYLIFKGNCEEAVNFFKECFNGEIGLMGRYGDSPMEVPASRKDKIVHVELKFQGNSILSLIICTEQKVLKQIAHVFI